MLKDTFTFSKDQRFKIVDGVSYLYDETRSKWLSTARIVFNFGIDHRNLNTDIWMRMDGSIPSNNGGYKISRNATIVSATVQTNNTTSGSFVIRRNGTTVDLATLTLIGEESKVTDILDVDLDEEDYLQALMQPVAKIDYPMLTVELAWRD